MRTQVSTADAIGASGGGLADSWRDLERSGDAIIPCVCVTSHVGGTGHMTNYYILPVDVHSSTHTAYLACPNKVLDLHTTKHPHSP